MDHRLDEIVSEYQGTAGYVSLGPEVEIGKVKGIYMQRIKKATWK
jgi:hypothetical protein